MSASRSSALIDPKRISISSKLRPFVSGISLAACEVSEMEVFSVNTTHAANKPIPTILMAANIKKTLYPKCEMRVGVTFATTKSGNSF
jgi:hypothetical protein